MSRNIPAVKTYRCTFWSGRYRAGHVDVPAPTKLLARLGLWEALYLQTPEVREAYRLCDTVTWSVPRPQPPAPSD